MINWDTSFHSHQYKREIKTTYNNEYKKNRKSFTNWIGKISIKFYKNNLDWHISTPASRNPFVSDLYKNICIIKTITKLIKKNNKIKVIIFSKKLFDLLKKIKNRNKNNSIEIIYKKKNINFIFFKNYLKSFLFQCIIFICVKILVKKKKLKNNIILIDYFHIEQNFYNNRYYRQVSSKKFLKNKNILYVPTFILGIGIIKTIKNILHIKDNKNILFKENLLSFKDLLDSFLYYRNLKNFKKKYLNYNKIDVSDLIYEELKVNTDVNTIIISKLNYYFIKKLKEKKIYIKKTINWFENQQIDRAWNYSFRKFHKKTTILGYQGFTLYPQYMCTHPSLSEEICKVIPKKIIVIGKQYVNSRKEFFRNINLLNGPALNFQNVFKIKKISKNLNSILIILPGYRDIDNILISWSKKIANFTSIAKIIIKPHPLSQIDNELINQKFNNKIEISKLPLFILFRKTYLVVSCGPTSATIEAIAYGKKVIMPILDVNDELILKLLKIDKNLFMGVKNFNELVLVLKRIISNRELIILRQKSLTHIKKNLFNKLTNQNIKLFC